MTEARGLDSAGFAGHAWDRIEMSAPMLDAGLSDAVIFTSRNLIVQVKAEMSERDGVDDVGYLVRWEGAPYKAAREIGAARSFASVRLFGSASRPDLPSGLWLEASDSGEGLGVLAENFSHLLRVVDDIEAFETLFKARFGAPLAIEAAA